MLIENNNLLYDQIINHFETLWQSTNATVLSQNILAELETHYNETNKYQRDILDKFDELKIDYAFDFIFPVNKTFLNFTTHPITIRKKYYDKLEETIKEDRYKVKILVNYGKSYIPIEGYIYRGYAGYGLYYQIRIKNDEYVKIANNFQLKERIKVSFAYQNNEWLIKLERI